MLALTEPKILKLRDYQLDATEALRAELRAGKKSVILCAPTGAGKTVMAANLLHQADQKGRYALFLVDRVALVDQTSQTLENYGITHGVLQAKHPLEDRKRNVQVCSIQTLANRQMPRDPDLILWDEAHTRYQSIVDYLALYPEAIKVGLTATPFTCGMGKQWEGMVVARTTRQLITDGVLIEPKVYICKSPDDDELGLNSFGEFSEESAANAGIRIIGDVVSSWTEKTFEHFGGPEKTIVFAANVQHGAELCQAFNDAGFTFRHISYEDKKRGIDRDEVLREFRRPDSMIHGLISCGVLTKGFDVPDIKFGISCRPYRKSLSNHIQELGRTMRSADGKLISIWNCHSGNFERFAADVFDVWDNGPGPLDKSEKRDSIKRERSEVTRKEVVCPECNGAMRGGMCMACGWERPARSTITAVEGTLQEFNLGKHAMEPRAGLRADCLKDPRAVWEACLFHTMSVGRSGEEKARKWAFAMFKGIYPGGKMPFGWFDMRVPLLVKPDALALIEREVSRSRKQFKARRAA